MNKVILMGRLTADPEIRTTTGNEHTIARFSLAVDRRVARGEAKTDFFNVQAWDKKAEFAEKYLHKGTKIVLTGRLVNDVVPKDGHNVTYTKIDAEDLEFAESRASSGGSDAAGTTANSSGFLNVPDSIAEELPFT